MTSTSCAIIGLASWYVAVLLMLAVFRVYLSAATRKAANTFAPDGSDVPGFGQRLVRVHANCYENIPLFIGVLLFALVTNQSAITDPSACWLLYARMGQCLVHRVSVSVPAVLARFSLFAVQLGLLLCWLWQFAQT
ncbi:MAG: MAPEG family protein [Pseudomonadales bacterium]|nr:MAPEG family protein [Pseudomonadales bacterium]